ncbi:MAG TPA: hypothetical protein VE226_04445, partial [Nitrososphaeraceae archaeon]|nr:hypothetical protein [Nitrososphaeraceae archaeon]
RRLDGCTSDKKRLSPNDTGSISIRRSRLVLLQLTKILLSYYWLNDDHYTLLSLYGFAPQFWLHNRR